MYWEIAQAEQSFPDILYAANDEPQLVYQQDIMIAAVIQGEIFAKFLDWYQKTKPPQIEDESTLSTPQFESKSLSKSFAESIDELQQLCIEEDYTLEILPRRDRPNAFIEVLDEIDEYYELSIMGRLQPA